VEGEKIIPRLSWRKFALLATLIEELDQAVIR
jgi:hypothetical protein